MDNNLNKADAAFLESYRKFRKEERRKKLLGDLDIPSFDRVAKDSDIKSLKEDISAILDILGYHRDVNLFASVLSEMYEGKKPPRFIKNVRVKKGVKR